MKIRLRLSTHQLPTHASLFSGIGGFDLAAQWAGWQNLFQVEIDEFCQSVLQKNFPNAQKFKDIKQFDGLPFQGRVDVVSGGFPCQPYSVAGNRKGGGDNRALWPEMLRVVREIQPTWIVGENVAGLQSMGERAGASKMVGDNVAQGVERSVLYRIIENLEEIDYSVQLFTVPACAVGAVHRRDRIWIVAHAHRKRESQPKGDECEIGGRYSDGGKPTHANTNRVPRLGTETMRLGGSGRLACNELDTDTFCEGNQPKGAIEYRHCDSAVNSDANSPRWEERNIAEVASGERLNSRAPNAFGTIKWQPNTSEVLRAAYGIPGRVDKRGARIKALGNAIVPQVAYNIFKAIESTSEADTYNNRNNIF